MASYEAVVSGIGGAFPESAGLDNFIDNLLAGKNFATVDDRRWKPGMLGTSPHVGKIGNVHHFDNNLFRVHKPLAQLMDPLARLMLERSLEAVIDSGLPLEILQNTNTMVSMTATVSESESRTCSILQSKKAAGYAIMAASKTMMSNRISYFLNLKGPSITLDGDWTVATVALRRAAKAIETGECEYALIGAANTCLFPELNKIYENLGFVSSDGRNRALDANGTGCFRSEGAVVFLLQRADTARRAYARIAGVHEMCVGQRKRFVAVSTSSLAPLITELYQRTGIDTRHIKFLGADGNAIPEIESKELDATAEVLCKNRRNSPLPVSTSKSVIGNTDAVTALISIIHAIAIMERGCIPPVLHFTQPTPAAALTDGRLKVITSQQKLPIDDESLLAINTLGWSGGISHVILRPNTRIKSSDLAKTQDYPRLVIGSGRTEEDSLEVIRKIVRQPFDAEFIRLTQESFSTPIPGYGNRSYAVIPSDVSGVPPTINFTASENFQRPVWIVYSGMGSQWAGMGKGLLQIPIFQETIQRLQPLLEPEGIDLTHALTTDDSSLFENIIYSFICIAAIQIGLTNILRELGVKISGIVGHSTGELGCAYGDGCLTEEETLLSAYARGKASLAVKLIPGMMAAVGMGWKEAMQTVPKSIDVACHNSVDNCSISGPAEDIKSFVEELKEKNIFARMINVSNIAFHSRYVEPVGALLKELLMKAIRNERRRSERWIASSLNPGDENLQFSKFGGVDYFVNNLLSPVRFEEAFKSVPPNAVVIEVAPHGLLQPLIRRELPDGAVTLSLTRRGHPDGARLLLDAVGKLFLEGVSVKPWVLAPEVPLPVSRGTPSLASLTSWDHREEWPIIVNSRVQVSRPVYVPLYTETTPCVRHLGHRFCAPSVLLEIVWKQIAELTPLSQYAVKFEMLEFTNPTEIHDTESKEIELQIQRETGLFELATAAEKWEDSVCLLKGKVSRLERTEGLGIPTPAPNEREGISLNKEDVYAELGDQDLLYDDSLKSLRRVTLSERETTGLVCWSGQWHVLLDSLFQIAALTSNHGSILRSKIRSITIAPQEMRSASNALPVRHDLVQRTLIAPGVLIEGYRNFEVTEEDKSISRIQIDCKGLGIPTNMHTEDFLKAVALQLVQNSTCKVHAVQILTIDNRSSTTAVQLRKALRHVLSNKATVKIRNLSNERDVPRDMEGVLVFVTNSKTPSDIIARLKDQLLGASALSRSAFVVVAGLVPVKTQFVNVASNHSPNGDKLTLFAMKHNIVPKHTQVIYMENNEEVPENVDSCDCIVLVWRGQPQEGAVGALASIKCKTYGDRARMVVILDDDSPAFSLTDSFFAEQLSLGLMLNVLQGGVWNSLHFQTYRAAPAIPTGVSGLDILCLGLNAADLDTQTQQAVRVLDYSGIRKGQRVMGIARRCVDSGAMPDDTLSWTVPNDWTDQEAASVPVAYSVAYHSLIVLGRLRKPTEKVLIMNGVSSVGYACIRVALAVTSHVYVTVTCEEQKMRLLSSFPQIKSDCILRSDEGSFEIALTKMCKYRESMVINSFDVAVVDGSGETVDMMFRALNNAGRVVILSKSDLLAEKIGMKYFLKNIGIMAGGYEALLSTKKRDKEAVKVAVLHGISTGVVVPLQVEHVQSIDLLCSRRTEKQVITLNHLPETRNLSLRDAAYAIAGGNANSLVTVARAACSRGAEIILAASRQCGTPLRARFVPALKRTSFVPYPKTPEEAKSFLLQTTKIRNLKAIVMNVEDPADYSLACLINEALSAVNGSLKGIKLLVLAESLTLGSKTVRLWRHNGLQACAIVGDKRQTAKILPSLLTLNALPEVVLTFRNGPDCCHAFGLKKRERVVHNGYGFPGRQERAAPFTELTSLSPRLRQREDPTPLFSVCGAALRPTSMAGIARSVLSPVLMVHSNTHMDAEDLVERILQVQPRGPWAVFGHADAAPLLQRAAVRLEERAGRPDWKETVSLALLEGDWEVEEGEGAHAGPLHLISHYDGTVLKSVRLDERKTKHFVVDMKDIATVLNDNLLSPLTKIVTC